MKRTMSIIMLMVLITMIFSCKKKEDAADNDKKEELKFAYESIYAVNVKEVEKDSINNYLELNGDIKAKREIAVFPDVAGKLARINVKVGDYVVKNAVIAEIDPSRPGSTYSLSPVRAPVTGTITNLPTQIGSTVSFQSVIANIGSLDQIEMITYVSEKYISYVKNGLPGIITVDAYGDDKTFSARVTQISPVVNPVTRMMEVKLNVTDPDKSGLKSGMFANVKIITEQKNNIIKIASDNIIKRYGEDFVFIIDYLPPSIQSNQIIKLNEELTADDKKLFNKIYPVSIPDRIPRSIFNTEIFDKIKDDDNKKLLEESYLLLGNKNNYTIADDISTEKIENIFEILTEINYIFDVNCIKSPTDNDKNSMIDIFRKIEFLDSNIAFVKKTLIEKGIEIDGTTEITQGLSESNIIVTNGQTLLEDNAVVKIIDK